MWVNRHGQVVSVDTEEVTWRPCPKCGEDVGRHMDARLIKHDFDCSDRVRGSFRCHKCDQTMVFEPKLQKIHDLDSQWAATCKDCKTEHFPCPRCGADSDSPGYCNVCSSQIGHEESSVNTKDDAWSWAPLVLDTVRAQLNKSVTEVVDCGPVTRGINKGGHFWFKMDNGRKYGLKRASAYSWNGAQLESEIYNVAWRIGLPNVDRTCLLEINNSQWVLIPWQDGTTRDLMRLGSDAEVNEYNRQLGRWAAFGCFFGIGDRHDWNWIYSPTAGLAMIDFESAHRREHVDNWMWSDYTHLQRGEAGDAATPFKKGVMQTLSQLRAQYDQIASEAPSTCPSRSYLDAIQREVEIG